MRSDVHQVNELSVLTGQVLDGLRQRNGLYVASPSDTYHYVWIRDNCYIALADRELNSGRYVKTYHALLDVFRKHKWKLAYHATNRPAAVHEYIHPRYTSDSLDEIWVPWGNAQNDAIGAFLFGIGEGLHRDLPMLRDDTDREVINLLIQYLQTLQYWRDEDNGIWEEARELHTSSIGACAAGLLAVKPYFDVPMEPVKLGMQTLYQLLPRESALHATDLSLLSLVYPYDLLPKGIAAVIVAQVEEQLLRDRGVIRYPGDKYYGEDGTEAEWCMGLPWLGLCHMRLGNRDKAIDYYHRTERVMTSDGAIPELYLAKEGIPNENTPLGWAHSLYLVLHQALQSQL